MDEAARLGTGRLPGFFIARWILTFVLPTVVVALGQLTIYRAIPNGMPLPIAVALPYITWVAIAFLQFLLLRGLFPHRRLWLATTIIGGIIGQIGGTIVQVLVQTAMDRGLLYGADFRYATVDSWFVNEMLMPYGHMVLGSIATFLILSITQSYCFAATMRERLPWIGTSVVAAFSGSLLGVAAFLYTVPAVMFTGILEFIPTPIMFNLVPYLIEIAINFSIVGLMTGACMKALLFRSAALQRSGLVGQFD